MIAAAPIASIKGSTGEGRLPVTSPAVAGRFGWRLTDRRPGAIIDVRTALLDSIGHTSWCLRCYGWPVIVPADYPGSRWEADADQFRLNETGLRQRRGEL